MISKADLKTAIQSLPAGEPPTGDEIDAYLRGQLSAAEAERLQERLADYPELARVLATPFPAADDPDVRAYVRRMRRRENRVLLFWRTAAIAASVIAAVSGGLLFQMQTKARRLAAELARPRTDLENALLLPDGQRGSKPGDESPITLPAAGENFLLIPALINQPQFRRYRVDIVDLNTSAPRTIWSNPDIHRRTDDTFEIWLPRTFLADGGIYQIAVYGIDGTTERLARYTIKVPRRADHIPY